MPSFPAFPAYENRHNAVGAWFLGPHAENFSFLEEIFRYVLEEQGKARKGYFPDDQDFVTKEMQASRLFQENIEKLKKVIGALAPRLAQHSVPFWNPRYNGHMNMDTSMPGIAGYLMAMLFNPNNVATEGSPLTSVLEIQVGKQLCEMVGLNIDIANTPTGWGHITCDGSVANLESMWAARNLKFYPLSLTLAMDEGGPLDFIAETFFLTTATGEQKLFKHFTTWELLNIIPDVVLNIPDLLYKQYSFTPKFLQATMQNYLVQTTAKDSDAFVKRFGLEQLNQMAYITSATKHYSWPKSAAVTGIGSGNLISIQVDDSARIEVKDLRRRLDECLNKKRAIYAVVAIIGSTEQGACDPLKEIVEIRDEYRKKGLGFVLHADAAWGAYFSTTLRDPPTGPIDRGGSFVPSLALKPSTQDSLRHLRYCDSITVDPHKSGYIQYPAGGLLYRDQRMRYLVTWTSPIVYRNDLESVGVYGIEGSKPGAAPVATWVSHHVIGLHQDGYGALLGEALFSCVKMYSHLATMSTRDTDFIVTPLNMLPAEGHGQDVEAEKEFIRKRILNVPNEDLVRDRVAMNLVKEMGSDLSINAFAVNFRVNGRVNEDVIEANDLNRRIFTRLSMDDDKDVASEKPLILTSTQFAQADYTTCLTTFKNRLGLKGQQDLYTLVNVVMSPFPTDANFTAKVAQALQDVIEQEVQISKFRNTITPDFHGFIMQGFEKVYLVHLPMFNMANHRFQLIITGDLPEDVRRKYVEARQRDPRQFFTLANAKKDILADMLEQGSFEAVIDKGIPPSDESHFITGFKLTNIRVLVNRHLDSKYLAPGYPEREMPFFIYGTPNERHIDHVLVASPNIMLCADRVKIAIKGLPPHEGPFYARFMHVPENAMQPFPTNADIGKDPSFFFRPGATFDFQAVTDPKTAFSSDEIPDSRGGIATGKLMLTDNLFVDTDMLNENPKLTDHHGSALLRGSFDAYTQAPSMEHHTVPLLRDDDKKVRGQGWIDIINAIE